jgi:hypothetical protein
MRSACILVALVLLAPGSAPRAGDKPADENKLDALDRFAGEWAVEGKWADGDSLKARSVYEWGLGKKILRARTYVMNGDKEYQRYEGFWPGTRRRRVFLRSASRSTAA